MSRRVVVTGIGVISPNANDIEEFDGALRNGLSGIRHVSQLADLKFGCTVAGVPQGVDELASQSFDEEQLLAMNNNQRFGCLAALNAWTDAGFERPDPADDRVHWEAGTIIGNGIGGLDTVAERLIPLTDSGRVRRLGSTLVEQVMGSAISARVAGMLALGNQVTANSAACSTGTEAVFEGLQRIRIGLAERMLCGGSEGACHYIWAGFDAMRVLCRKYNDDPARASRPMSASAAGFVPSAGSGVLHLEHLDHALDRGARIYAEVLGGAVNCGGHRQGGSMTAPNPESVQRCIRMALTDARVSPLEVDAISGHLTATGADSKEVNSWATALGRGPDNFPALTAPKSIFGHGLGAAGGIESVACILMLRGGYVHPSINCEDLHPELQAYAASIPHTVRHMPELKTLIKASFGFGDVNSCLVFRKWEG